jgi:uncharacterized protein with HEPN domain
VSRDQAGYVADRLEACERICSYVVDLNERTFCDDTKTVDAILRNLAVLGEAAKAGLRRNPRPRSRDPMAPNRWTQGRPHP